MKLVAWFNEVDRNHIALAGGKGANLGEMTKVGLPVPPGFVVTADAYSQFLSQSGLQPEIERCIGGADTSKHDELQRVAADIKRLINGATIPAEVTVQIARVFGELNAGPVAVRSSATAEDLAEASFAGQQSTFLNVHASALNGAVQNCWASLFESQAISYRERHGFKHMDVRIAVVVQEMVQSRRSGVMFTVHPVTGDHDKIVIEAAYGLGEAVVSGAVTPDMYIVDRQSLQIEEKMASPQERELVRNPDASPSDEANVWAEIAPERGQMQKLSDDEVSQLAELGCRIEAHYGTPQDIEWAEEGGRFYVVQSRPVTTAG